MVRMQYRRLSSHEAGAMRRGTVGRCPQHISRTSRRARCSPGGRVIETRGSSFVQVGTVLIGCMDPDYRATLDEAMEEWRAHLASRERDGFPMPEDHVYAFAYWLFRWSGLVTPAATPADASGR